LRNLALAARDGDIGRCRDLLFDDQTWTVRYLEVNTSRWLLGRRVLISPAAVLPPDLDNERLPVQLDRADIENAPDIARDEPVSRQYEEAFSRHFGYSHYWAGTALWGSGPFPGDMMRPVTAPAPEEDDQLEGPLDITSHLRSAAEVRGYRIQALDGDIGVVDDFVIDTPTWSIVMFGLDTRRWLPGRKVLLPVAWNRDISWAERKVSVDVSVDAIRTAPEIDDPMSPEAVTEFYRHFGREGATADPTEDDR
jgi:hypothetical protein